MSAPLASRPAWTRLGWLIGVPVLALLWAGASSVVGPHLSDSVAEEGGAIARATREAGREPWLRIESVGRDLVALGEAPNADLQAAAVNRLRAIPGLRRLDDRTGLIATESPFVLSATLEPDGTVAIGGARPAETGAATLAQRLSAALPGGSALRDRSRAAYGAPPGFLAAAEFAVARLRDYRPGAVATVSDTTLSFEGQARDPAADERLRTAFAAPPSGFGMGRVAAPPPEIEAFRFAIERRPDGGFRLAGHAVSEAARAEITGLLRQAAPGSAVDDGLQIARGMPAAIDPSAIGRFAVRLSLLLQSGTVAVDRATLSVSGSALDARAAAEIETAMREARPSGASVGSLSVTVAPVSPYRVTIRREDGVVHLSGHLPNEAAREALRAALRTRFFDEAVTDRTRIAEGAPENLDGALVAGIGSLSTLARGEIAVSDLSLRLDGESLYPASAEALAVTLPRSVPRGWSAAVSVRPLGALPRRDAATCARLLSERLGAQRLLFAPGSSELRPDFYPHLDAVAALMKSCPTHRVEVAGYADAPGTPAAPFPDLPVATREKPSKPPVTAAAKPNSAPAPGKPAPERDKTVAGSPKKDAKATAPKETVAKETVAKPETVASAAPIAPALPAAIVPEPALDLPQMRALAIVDYLQKAGVPADRVQASSAAPGGERQGVTLALRS